VRIDLDVAAPEQAFAVAALRNAAASALTVRYGTGPWSLATSERGVLFEMRRGTVYLATHHGKALATLILSTRKPWAIDTTWFTACSHPLYLTAMTVDPDFQRTGVGRQCLEEAVSIAARWPSGGIRLDAWDAEVGAGGFYRKCGFREAGRGVYRQVPLIYFERII
jgi:GNAT superfamily N-acetyltransferase